MTDPLKPATTPGSDTALTEPEVATGHRRRVFATTDLSEQAIAALERVRMHPRHAHLDAELDAGEG